MWAYKSDIYTFISSVTYIRLGTEIVKRDHVAGSGQSAVSRRDIRFLRWNASSLELSFPSVTWLTDFQTATVLSNSISSSDDAEQRPPANTQWLWSITGNRWWCFKPCFGDICCPGIIKPIMTDSTLGIVNQTFNIRSPLCSANSISFSHSSFLHSLLF